MPVLTGGTPSATTTAWCVAVEPIESGKVGRVAVGGVVQCKLDIDAEAYSFASPQASTVALKAGLSGDAAILWKESGTGSNKWGLVRIGSPAVGIRHGTFTGQWLKGSSAIVSDSSSSSTFEAMNYFADLFGSGTRKCAIGRVADGFGWILLAAEC
jgi:hypothetical protein